MTNRSESNQISVRGMIKDYRLKLVPIEDDVQHATEFHIHVDEKEVRSTSLEDAVSDLVSILEKDGTLNGVRSSDDCKQAVRSRFDRTSPDLIVEAVVRQCIGRNFVSG